MAEPRKIVLILGNGFDLDLGLKTSYKDFWESKYCPKDHPSPIIQHLNGFKNDNRSWVKWYDLENELLNYYHSIKNTDPNESFLSDREKEFLNLFQPYLFKFGVYNDSSDILKSLYEKSVIVEDIVNNRLVVPYKQDVYDSISILDKKGFHLIKKQLSLYLDSLKDQPIRNNSIAASVLSAISYSRSYNNDVKVYSFNYTPIHVIEEHLAIPKPHYIHGSCLHGDIIMGTRDDKSIREEYDFIQKSFDLHYNPPALVNDLSNADEVIIFGHSLGENDWQYFMPFLMQQKTTTNHTRKEVTFFTLNETSILEIKREIKQMTDGDLISFLNRNSVSFIRTAEINKDIEKYKSFLIRHLGSKDGVDSLLNRLSRDK